MKKIDSLNQVAEFHKTFDAPILEKPTIPSEERCQLRVSLLQEELNELKEAIENKDLVKVYKKQLKLHHIINKKMVQKVILIK